MFNFSSPRANGASSPLCAFVPLSLLIGANGALARLGSGIIQDLLHRGNSLFQGLQSGHP